VRAAGGGGAGRWGCWALLLLGACALLFLGAPHLRSSSAQGTLLLPTLLARPLRAGDAARSAGTFLLLLAYGAAVIPLAYCCSFAFDSPSSAQVGGGAEGGGSAAAAAEACPACLWQRHCSLCRSIAAPHRPPAAHSSRPAATTATTCPPQVSVSALTFVLGFMLVVASETMKAIPECRALQAAAVHLARLLPPFNLGEGLIALSAYHFQVGRQGRLAGGRWRKATGGAHAACCLPGSPQQHLPAFSLR
jgi:hypothetical protein